MVHVGWKNYFVSLRSSSIRDVWYHRLSLICKSFEKVKVSIALQRESIDVLVQHMLHCCVCLVYAKQGKKYHSPNKEEEEMMHVCLECGDSFGQAGNLNRHMLTHSEVKTHTCSECKKSFGLAQHLRSRAGKSKSLIRWKRRKSGKRQEKAEKADLVMQLAFWQKYISGLWGPFGRP